MLDLKTKLLTKTAFHESGCWMYLGTWDDNQYGQLTHEGVRIRAHVASYTVHIGPIPEGLCVLHECDNPWCVNPKHLFVGTKKDNYEDMRAKGRAHFNIGEAHPFAILTEKDVVEVRELLEEGYSQRVIGEHFGVSRSAIRDIKLGKHWRCVP